MNCSAPGCPVEHKTFAEAQACTYGQYAALQGLNSDLPPGVTVTVQVDQRKWLGVDYDNRSRSVFLCAECGIPMSGYRTSRDSFEWTYCEHHKHFWGTTR